jgi:subtilisin family serine protease
MTRRARILALLLLLPWGIASLSGMPVRPDERKIDPVLIESDVPAVRAVQRKIIGGPARAQSSFPLFFRLATEDPSFPDTVRGLGGTAIRVAPRLYAGRIPMDAARYLSNRPEVAYLEVARRARTLLDLSAPAVFADNVQAGSAGWPPPFDTGIQGNNVYVGVVDTGLNGAHNDFHTGIIGSPTRVVHTYSSPDLPTLNPPLSPNWFVDEAGHGTHVTGIAAGNGFSSAGTYTGMAPKSPLLIGKTTLYESDILIAVSDLVTFAESISTPVSLNLSLGDPTGPHDGTSTFESGIDNLAAGSAGSKRLIVVSAGNERTDGEHFRTTLPPFGIVTEFLTLDDITGVTTDIWADGEDWYAVTVTMGSESVTLDSNFATTTKITKFSSSGNIKITATKNHFYNGDTNISVFFLPPAAGQSARIRLTHTRNGGTGTVDGYIDGREGTFDTAVEDGTNTEPANADHVISVGSFNTKPGGGPGTIGGISYFSSLGPTRDGRTKPDVAAPGSLIYSARSSDVTYSPIEIVPANDNYVIKQGTSMAAPHVTGIAALVWESNLALTGAQMRERLKKTADPPTGAPDNTWGHGKVNALRAVTESVASITAPAIALPGSPVTVTSENSSGAFGNTLTGYSWGLTRISPLPAGPRSVISTSSTATFTPTTPGDYEVDLTVSQSTPAGTAMGTDTATIHVNHIPIASISGPASSDNTDPVTFHGTVSDADAGQTETFHWILLSRPTGSGLVLLTKVGVDNATLSPDIVGTYEVGLRVDDTLDNSALVTKSFAANVAASSGGGGGGSCSILVSYHPEQAPAPLSASLPFLLPLLILGIRRAAWNRKKR